jgi:hypothetical protein
MFWLSFFIKVPEFEFPLNFGHRFNIKSPADQEQYFKKKHTHPAL